MSRQPSIPVHQPPRQGTAGSRPAALRTVLEISNDNDINQYIKDMSPIAPISPPLRATLKEVADQAGVSVITASRVLNGGRSGLPVSEATRQRVETSAAELGYRPHASGRTLRTRRTGQVGTLVLNNRDKPLTNIPAYEYLLGINAGLEPADVLMTQVRLTDLDGADPGRIRVLRECTLDGFVVTGSIPAAVSEFHSQSRHVCA